jgi:homogentisate 1,2-dioxygenase
MTDTTERVDAGSTRARTAQDTLVYQSGLGNELETEALAGTLPLGQNSPQKVAHGLVSELVSGTTFTAPRALTRRSYLFRIRPSVVHGRFERIDNATLRTPPFDLPPSPNNICWGPVGNLVATGDFVDGLATLCGNGSPNSQSGMAVHVYSAVRSMRDRVFADADGELMIIPQNGRIRVFTELGKLDVGLGEIAVIPRGLKFRVELLDDRADGFVCENFGLPLRLPELGLIGTNGLANVNDFEIPVAAFEDQDRPVQMIHKFGGNLWSASLTHSPLDVVAWRGSLYPYKYNLDRFVAMGTLTVDHPDPSIFALLTSPSDSILGPNFDVMALTPRWLVSEKTFRPPGYHRNCVVEFSIFLAGEFGGKELVPGSTVLNNNWSPHGPGTRLLEMGREAESSPQKIEDQKILLLESRFPMQITKFAETVMPRVSNFADQWGGFTKRFAPHRSPSVGPREAI